MSPNGVSGCLLHQPIGSLKTLRESHTLKSPRCPMHLERKSPACKHAVGARGAVSGCLSIPPAFRQPEMVYRRLGIDARQMLANLKTSGINARPTSVLPRLQAAYIHPIRQPENDKSCFHAASNISGCLV